jgi:hypothetical protein
VAEIGNNVPKKGIKKAADGAFCQHGKINDISLSKDK